MVGATFDFPAPLCVSAPPRETELNRD